MSAREFLAGIRRRWYVPVAILLVALAATFVLYRDGGIYTTRTVVSFRLPAKTDLSANNGQDDSSVIAFASSVAQLINDGAPPQSYSQEDAPLYGAGIRQGVLVSLPNSGNQWTPSYSRADIEIQIAGRSAKWVAAMQKSLLAEVQADTAKQQGAVDAGASTRISADVVPLTERIDYVGPTRSTKAMAFLAMLIAALVVGGWGAIALDRLVTGRTFRRPALPALTPTQALGGR